jgi:hypothetical protein
MGIPEEQLETWSHQGAIASSKTTYSTIKSVLESAKAPYRDKQYKVFLQGSYGNDTNVWAESDVDVVIRLDSCFHNDLALLDPAQKSAQTAAYSNATYCQAEFKRDVIKILTEAFPNDVTGGNKAIAIKAGGSRRKADVIAATAFRRYYRFKSIFDESYAEGICFWDKSGERTANYPDQHCTNLTLKHQATGNRLKPTIRMMKNLRQKLVEEGMLDEGVAPSYYIEGLLYNVPNEKFTSSLGDTFCSAINWIRSEADKTKLVTANEQYFLLRDNAKTCWPPAHAEAFFEASVQLWNSW